jgi:hypothetical protein
MPKDERINLGSLKLFEDEAQAFKNALEYYELESCAFFLRRAAMALIRHHKRGLPLSSPLEFKDDGNGSL